MGSLCPGCCRRDIPRTESTESLITSEQDEEGVNRRTVDRTTVSQTTINVRHQNGKPPPRPVTYSDIPSPVNGLPPTNLMHVKTEKGIEVVKALQEAYSWKDVYTQPTLEFSYKTNILFTSCEQHLSELSKTLTEEMKVECDTIIRELLNLRAHWGVTLLPLSMRNAFVRERVTLKIGSSQTEFRIDCIQFFEPIVFYGNSPGKQEDLVKLFVFVVNDTEKEEVTIRYYLERSYLFDFYHVLCFFQGSSRGQLKPYGNMSPSYWTLRQDVLQNVKSHLESMVSKNKQSGLQPIAATVFPTPRNTGPVNV